VISWLPCTRRARHRCTATCSTVHSCRSATWAKRKQKTASFVDSSNRIEVELKEPTSLKQAQEIAERYDSLTYETGASGSNRAYGGRNTGQYYPSAPRMQYSGPTPMDVGAMNVGRDAPQDVRAQRAQGSFVREGLACSWCKAKGHTAQQCPNRRNNSGGQRSRNPSQGNARPGRR